MKSAAAFRLAPSKDARASAKRSDAAAQNAGVEIDVSVLVRYELEVGVKRAANPTRARAVLEAKGQSIGPVDILLAGQAVARGADFVTSNLVEFKRVPGLRVAVAERSWIAR
jgi:predicted nucleic acid-binding protein